VVGTLNPSRRCQRFLLLEQAILARLAPDRQRTAVFARQPRRRLIGAVGALFAGFTEVLAGAIGVGPAAAMQRCFAYGPGCVLSGLIYRKMPPN
jgi:hypothetical protein